MKPQLDSRSNRIHYTKRKMNPERKRSIDTFLEESMNSDEISMRAIYIDEDNKVHEHQTLISSSTNLATAYAYFIRHWEVRSKEKLLEYVCCPPLTHVGDIGVAIEQGHLQPYRRFDLFDNLAKIWTDLQMHDGKHFFVFRHPDAQVEQRTGKPRVKRTAASPFNSGLLYSLYRTHAIKS